MSGKLYARFVPQEIKHDRGIMRHMQLKWLPSIVEKIDSTLFYEQKGRGYFWVKSGYGKLIHQPFYLF